MSASDNRVSKNARLTLRMPESWRNRVTDRKLSTWLRSIPPSLAPDPGGGLFRRSFALTSDELLHVKQHARMLRTEPSTLVRRLIATHLEGAKRNSPPAVSSTRLGRVTDRIASIPERASGSGLPAAPSPPAVPSEQEGKKAFRDYVSELERIAQSGTPESGEAQVRLARIRENLPRSFPK